jgi:hypothetical protein
VRRLAKISPVPLSQRVRPLGAVSRPLAASENAARVPLTEPVVAAQLEDTASMEPPAVPVPIEVVLPPVHDHGGSLHSDEALCVQITSELRTSMRGRTVVDLATQLGVSDEQVIEAAALLTARGQVVRRGAKLFVA